MNFLFDIGNVILGIDFISSLKKVIPKDLPNVDDRLDTIMYRKDEFEAGRVPTSDYFPWAAKQVGMAEDLEIFMQAWTSIFKPNLPMWETIEQLYSEGHRLFLFSNINNPHKDYILKNYSIFENFTNGIFSFETGHIKPEKEIYDMAILQCDLNPAETIYIDDLPANILAGKEAGFLSHEYRIDQHDKFLAWLETTLKP